MRGKSTMLPYLPTSTVMGIGYWPVGLVLFGSYSGCRIPQVNKTCRCKQKTLQTPHNAARQTTSRSFSSLVYTTPQQTGSSCQPRCCTIGAQCGSQQQPHRTTAVPSFDVTFQSHGSTGCPGWCTPRCTDCEVYMKTISRLHSSLLIRYTC
jgi:hypothetical protein